MPSSETVGTLSFLNTAASYTIGSWSGGVLTLNNNLSNAQINDFGGSHTIAAWINVAGNNSLNVTVSNPGDTLTISGAVQASNGPGTIYYSGAGNLIMTGGVWPISAFTDTAAGNLSISGSLGAAGAVTNSGSGNMSISGGATMASLTNSSTGSVSISGGATVNGAVLNSAAAGNMSITGGATITGNLTNSSPAGLSISGGAFVNGTVTNSASAGNLTFPGGLSNAVTLTNNSIVGSVSITQPALSSGSIGTINGASGSSVVLGGDPTSTTTVTNILDTAGQTVQFNGGNWILNGQGQYETSLVVQSGLVTRPYGTGDFYDLESLTIHGGTLNSANTFGIRMGNQFGANYVGDVDVPFTGVQDGGLLTLTNTNGQQVEFGTAAAGFTDSYTLSGGTFSTTNGLNLRIGARPPAAVRPRSI